MLHSFIFSGNMWAFNNAHQRLLPKRTKLEIEYLYAKNRFPIPENIEALGNKSMLEKDVNICHLITALVVSQRS